MKRLIATCAAFLITIPGVALAQATVFVPMDAGFAWWTSELVLLPQAKSDGGLSVAEVDAWTAAQPGMKEASRTCYMSFVRDNEIVAPDRATHNEIRAKLSEFPNSFTQSFEPAQGERFLVRVGVFELCEEPNSAAEPLRFMAIVVTDNQGKIRDFDALDWNFMRLHKSADGKLSVFGCYNCGERRELSWDKGSNRFYYTWTGR